MREKIESAAQSFTGVLPAEPGWRVVITNGKERYLAPVIGWCWERHAWRADNGCDLDPIHGEPFIIDGEGAYVGSCPTFSAV